MTKTWFVDLLSLIKRNFIAFASICFFVVLAVGLSLGMACATVATENSIYSYLEQQHFSDIEILAPYGISEGELDRLRAIDGVDHTENAAYSYEELSLGDDRFQAMVSKVTSDTNIVSLRDGRLPDKEGEIVIEQSWAKENGLSIGDIICFTENYTGDQLMLRKLAEYSAAEVDSISEYLSSDDNGMECLTTAEFTVVGLAESPTYLVSGTSHGDAVTNGLPIDVLMFVSEDSFRSEFIASCNRVLIFSDSLRGYSYQDAEYTEKCKALQNSVETCLDEITEDKYDLILDNKAAVELRWEQDTEDKSAELDAAKAEYALNKDKLEDSRDALSEVRETVNNARAELDAAREELNGRAAELDELETKYGANNPAVISGRAKIEKADAELDIKEAALADEEDKLLAEEEKLADAESELAASAEEIESAETELSDARAKLSEFSDGAVEHIEATTLTRQYNLSYHYLELSNNMIGNLRYSLCGTFILIGLLVCYSAITRFVKQQTKLIGTKKALGIRKKDIFATFFTFTAFAVVLGSIIGTFIVSPIIQFVIVKTIQETYNIGKFTWSFRIGEALITSGLDLVILLAVTWFAIRETLNHSVISMLAGGEQLTQKQHFYEKLSVWKRLSLITKTIVNNFSINKMRVAATVVGITGATVLLVVSITLYNNVGGSIKTHFSDFFHFDTVVTLREADDATVSDIKETLEKHGAVGTAVYWKTTPAEQSNNEMTSLRLIVPADDEEFGRMVELYDAETGEKIVLSDGIFCSYSVRNWYGKEADSFSVSDKRGNLLRTDIDGFFDSYLCTAFLVADRETYKQIYGEEMTPNAFIVDTQNVDDISALKADLNLIEGYYGMSDFYAASNIGFAVIQRLVMVMVVVYMLISFAMSVLVLLNLLSQFITEKKKELIVLRINGYSVRDTKRYIYTDTIFLCVISVLLGAVIGSALGNGSISSFDISTVYLMRNIDMPACAIGIGVSALLTFIMSVISLKQIDKLTLSDINS